jgi:hypothetical protein
VATQTIVITGQGDLRRLIFRIGHWEKQENIFDACDHPMMVAGEQIKVRAQAAVLATPSKRQNARRGKPSLRRAIADAIEVRQEHIRNKNAAMVNVFANPSKMPHGKAGLASLYEGVSEWHHPVYGHEPVVYQSPHPFFGQATAGAHTALEVAANEALGTVARYIDA